MKRIGTISESERKYLLDIVNSRPWNYARDGDFFCQKGTKVGDFEGRVVKICPGGFLHPHKDEGHWKSHIVLQTNPKAITVCGGDSYNLEEGGIYRFDASVEHSAFNKGDTDRIHIIIESA